MLMVELNTRLNHRHGMSEWLVVAKQIRKYCLLFGLDTVNIDVRDVRPLFGQIQLHLSEQSSAYINALDYRSIYLYIYDMDIY